MKLVTSVSHILLSECAKNNPGTTRTSEYVMNFVKKLTLFFGFESHIIVLKHNRRVVTIYRN